MTTEKRTVESVWEHYAAIQAHIGDQGGGDITINDIAFLVAEIGRLRDALEHVDRLLTSVMDESNLHVFEPVAAIVTAALAGAHNDQGQTANTYAPIDSSGGM